MLCVHWGMSLWGLWDDQKLPDAARRARRLMTNFKQMGVRDMLNSLQGLAGGGRVSVNATTPWLKKQVPYAQDSRESCNRNSAPLIEELSDEDFPPATPFALPERVYMPSAD